MFSSLETPPDSQTKEPFGCAKAGKNGECINDGESVLQELQDGLTESISRGLKLMTSQWRVRSVAREVSSFGF